MAEKKFLDKDGLQYFWSKVKDGYIPVPSDTTPKAPGTAAAGSSTQYSRADHVHPLQTTVETATNATHATSADTATSATSAETATNATHATSADTANSATKVANNLTITVGGVPKTYNGSEAVSIEIADATAIEDLKKNMTYYLAVSDDIPYKEDGYASQDGQQIPLKFYTDNTFSSEKSFEPADGDTINKIFSGEIGVTYVVRIKVQVSSSDSDWYYATKIFNPDFSNIVQSINDYNSAVYEVNDFFHPNFNWGIAYKFTLTELPVATIKAKPADSVGKATAEGGEIFNDYDYNKATGRHSHAEGSMNTASKSASHVEGINNKSESQGSHAEGYCTIASGIGSHAEGKGYYVTPTTQRIIASGDGAHVEGSTGDTGKITASGIGSHAEGYSSQKMESSGIGSHAEGNDTLSIGDGSHAEGRFTSAKGTGAHAEGKGEEVEYKILSADIGTDLKYDRIGRNQELNGFYSGSGSIDFRKFQQNVTYVFYRYNDLTNTQILKVTNVYIDEEGSSPNTVTFDKTLDTNLFSTGAPVPTIYFVEYDKVSKENVIGAVGDYSHSEGLNCTASGADSHAEGNGSIASGYHSHAEGDGTIASGLGAHAEGGYVDRTEIDEPTYGACGAVGNYSHSEGQDCRAEGLASHAEGNWTTSIGEYSHSEGRNTVASGNYSHAEGNECIASKESSHAEGRACEASGITSHAEGDGCIASGRGSHAEGNNTTASGVFSHAEGKNASAKGSYSHANGFYATADTTYCTTVGKYNKTTATNDLFVVGAGSGSSSLSNALRITTTTCYSKGSWNTSGADYAEMFEWEDRNPDSEDRVGYFVTINGNKIKKADSNSFIIGIVSSTPTVVGNNPDDWKNMFLTDDWGRVIYEDVEVTFENGEKQIEQHPKLNPNYDPKQTYINRDRRKEWSSIGLMGQLLVHQDGTLTVGSFCKSNDAGIATKSDSGYYVMDIINDNIAKILFK